jgi:hypothetical protein
MDPGPFFMTLIIPTWRNLHPPPDTAFERKFFLSHQFFVEAASFLHENYFTPIVHPQNRYSHRLQWNWVVNPAQFSRSLRIRQSDGSGYLESIIPRTQLRISNIVSTLFASEPTQRP